MIRRVAGDINMNTLTDAWTDLVTDSDITLPAQVGDILEYSINGLAASSTGPGSLDVVTRVSGAALNSFGQAGAVTASPPGYGIQGWTFTVSATTLIVGSAWYAVVAGDIVSGQVTLRPRYHAITAARTLYSNANNPLFLCGKNLGQPDPN